MSIVENEDKISKLIKDIDDTSNNEIVYSNLLLYNPFELTNYYAYHFENDFNSIVLDVINVLKAILDSNQQAKRNSSQLYAINELVEKIDAVGYFEGIEYYFNIFKKLKNKK